MERCCSRPVFLLAARRRRGDGGLAVGGTIASIATSSPAGLLDLVCPEGWTRRRLEADRRGAALTQDLINTPACDMGPEELEAALRGPCRDHGARRGRARARR